MKAKTSNLCRWCGKTLDVVTTRDGRAIARQCPLCLNWAPTGQDVGVECAVRFRGVTAAEARVRREVRATRQARQLSLFGGRK